MMKKRCFEKSTFRFLKEFACFCRRKIVFQHPAKKELRDCVRGLALWLKWGANSFSGKAVGTVDTAHFFDQLMICLTLLLPVVM